MTITNIFLRIYNLIKIIKWRNKNISISDNFEFHRSIELKSGSDFFNNASGNIVIGRNCKFSKGVIIHAYGGDVIIEDNVFLGPYTVIYGHGNIKIGRDSLIAMGCKIISSNHSFSESEKLIRLQPEKNNMIEIGSDVWLGADVKVLAGVSVGTGSVVGAGSVVVEDIPPYGIAVGVPAKMIKKRD